MHHNIIPTINSRQQFLISSSQIHVMLTLDSCYESQSLIMLNANQFSTRMKQSLMYISLDSVYYLCFYRNLICVEMEMMA